MRRWVLLLLIFRRIAFYRFDKSEGFFIGIFRIIKPEGNGIGFYKGNAFAKRIDPFAVFRNEHNSVFVFAAVKGLYAEFFDFKNIYSEKIFFYCGNRVIPNKTSSAFKGGDFFSAKVVEGNFRLSEKPVAERNGTADFCVGNFYGVKAKIFCELFVININADIDVFTNAPEHISDVFIRSSEEKHARMGAGGFFVRRKPVRKHKFIGKCVHNPDPYAVGLIVINGSRFFSRVVIILNKAFGILVKRFSRRGKADSFKVPFKKKKTKAFFKTANAFFNCVWGKEKRFRRFGKTSAFRGADKGF